MTLGKKQKDGVIIKVKKQPFNYYHGLNDSNLKPLYKWNNQGIKTLKVYEQVSVANNEYTVELYPDGRIEVKSNAS
jgi:hypothetical protein